jgi:hypothetical protein
MYNRLNWKDHERDSSAQASRYVGGSYEIRRTRGAKEPLKPVHYKVTWSQKKYGNYLWSGAAMTLDEAKALAERAHYLAWMAAWNHIRAARLAAENAHKKAPHCPEDSPAQIEQEI